MIVTLVVSPTRAVQELLACSLAERSYAVVAVGTIGEALETVSLVAPDAIVIDPRAEQKPGECARLMDACSNSRTRIVCLATDATDRQHLIDSLGGREPLILTTPCKTDEVGDALAQARPQGQELPAVISLGPLAIYTEEGKLESAHGSVHLTTIELGVLAHLLRRNGAPASSSELLEKVWGQGEVNGSPDRVRAHMRNLRAKLRRVGVRKDIILTVPRRGYAIVWRH
jgi:DNA-binding response OmpR family regulator